MRLLRSLIKGWNDLRITARREFLRDPDVILFERVPVSESAGDR
jgi:hypothetical protein